MIRYLFLSFISTLLCLPQDVKVITYSTGKSNTNSYESLAFWIKDDKRAYIRYTHGTDTEDIDLVWAGPVTLPEGVGFKAQFPAPDNTCFYIIPQGNALKVQDKSGKTLQIYSWENEGQGADPAACPMCAKNEKQAMEWMKKYFLP